MKVLQINSVCGVGSTGKIAVDIDRVLKNQGHESVIAYGRGKAPEYITSIKIGNSLDNYLHAVKTRLLDRHGFASKEATNVFLKKVDEYNPDIIHLHNIHGYYINIELLFNYLKSRKKPIIWTLHDCWSFTGHCAYFDFEGCEKWKQGCYACPQKKSYPSSILLDSSKRNYIDKKALFTGVDKMKIITPSKWLSSLVKESFLGEYEVDVINNGIDLSVFKPQTGNFRSINNIEDKFVIVGAASTWEERKGMNAFIELSSMLDDSCKIVLIGLSEEQKKLLPNNIIGISRTNNVKEMAEIYSTANIFVNPTLEDNFPTTNIESLACGTPVITYNTGGSIESINKDCGSIVFSNTAKELFEIILEYKKETKDYSRSCVERALKLYNKDDRYLDYINEYKRLKEEIC